MRYWNVNDPQNMNVGRNDTILNGVLRDSPVSVVTRLRAGRTVLDSRQGRGRDFFSSPRRLKWLWVPPSLLFSW